jgi:hypothetical protein
MTLSGSDEFVSDRFNSNPFDSRNIAHLCVEFPFDSRDIFFSSARIEERYEKNPPINFDVGSWRLEFETSRQLKPSVRDMRRVGFLIHDLSHKGEINPRKSDGRSRLFVGIDCAKSDRKSELFFQIHTGV